MKPLRDKLMPAALRLFAAIGALATLIIDLVYPLLDPRISYRNT